MAKKRKAEDEEATESLEAQEEAAPAAPAGHEFVPEATHRPKSDAWTLMLVLTFLAFSVGAGVAGREAWEHYDVQFFMFSKEGKPAQETQPTESTEPTSAPAPAPPGGDAPAPAPAPPK
jgi:hypothetical protein